MLKQIHLNETADDKVTNNKKEKKSNDTLENRYENSISKIVEIEGTKKGSYVTSDKKLKMEL